MPSEFDRFAGAAPYSSEMYGLYQPLLGWRSQLTQRRIDAGWEMQRRRLFVEHLPRLKAKFLVEQNGHPLESTFEVQPAERRDRPSPLMADASSSLLARRIGAEAGHDPDRWMDLTRPEVSEQLLVELAPDIRQEHLARLQRVSADLPESELQAVSDATLQAILRRESLAAGLLGATHKLGDPADVAALLMPSADETTTAKLQRFVAARSAITGDAVRFGGVLSPIGLVHLFRQYFFEFDTFLGPSVHHLWLSPGATVEMVETSTTRKMVERSVDVFGEQRTVREQAQESTAELADTIKADNESNSKFGVSINTSSSFNIGPIYTGQVTTGTTYDASATQKTSREQVHKSLRRQAEKATTEVRRSMRTTLRTVTETTDTNSRRYLLTNTTTELVNYEMRRKMRQVGVQVQDAGTQLCWQVFVDKPGDDLGLANLVHVAAPTDLEPTVEPERTPTPEPYRGETLRYSFTWPLDDDDEDPAIYREFHVHTFPVVPRSGFQLSSVEIRVASEPKWGFAWRGLRPESVGPGTAETTPTEIQLFHPNSIDGHRQPLTDEHPRFDLEITPLWVPSSWLLAKVASDNAALETGSSEKTKRDFTEKIYQSVADRVTKSSNVQRRNSEELREEERIVVYRHLIAQLMANTGMGQADPRVQHVLAEVVQAMFDVDAMLYFVAPEWWLPHSPMSQQDVMRPDVDAATFETYHTVDWGGSRASRPANYLISDTSTPAPLGASLGWTLQIDGDNLRNAFLNAPWVKAVVPIRPGREREALAWLSAAEVEGSDGLDAAYEASDTEQAAVRADLKLPEGTTVTIRHAVDRLIGWLEAKHAAATEPVSDGPDAPTFLRADKVYEKGFDPLADGFRADPLEPFEVFDQWVEVMPTDQIVPVPVVYDPKTGRQK